MEDKFDYETEEDTTFYPQKKRKEEEEEDGGVQIAEANEEYSLVAPDENVKRVVIDCEIYSYAVERDGPGPIRSCLGFLGCGSEDNTRHMDEILHDITATFKPGEFWCLMGPSGAGKTTLLNVLAARAGGFMIGNVRLNNRVLQQKDMRMMLSYIPQDDTLFSSLTPRETLDYTARLRIADQTTYEREALVKDLMDKLGISRCADVIIGNELIKGISGGQKKRVSVAMELVTNPSILFVDEATSGLDSQTAEDVVRILRDISRTGRTVICTIHQPSFDIFRMFDKLLLLQAGQVVYNGSISASTRYFAKQGWACPEVLNPAEYYMKILTLEKPKTLAPENPKKGMFPTSGGETMMVGTRVIHRRIPGPWATAWRSHCIQQGELGKAESQPSFAIGASGPSMPAFPQKFSDDRFDDLDFPTSLIGQFMTLFGRALWMTLKDRQQFRARLILCTCVAIFTGLTYFQFSNDQSTIQNRQSLIFSSILFNGMNMLMNTVVLFPLERAVITREFQNGTYRMLAYYVSRVLTSILFQFVYVFFYVTVLYFMSGMYPGAPEYLLYVMTISLVGMIAVTLGLIIGAMVPSVNLGPSLVTPILMPLIVFSGYLITKDQIRKYFIWLYYISFFQYANHILTVTQLKKLSFNCCCPKDVEVCWCAGKYLDPPVQCPPYCDCHLPATPDYKPHPEPLNSTGCLLGSGCMTGRDFLQQNNIIDNQDLATEYGLILFGMWLFLVVSGYFVMLWRGRKKTA